MKDPVALAYSGRLVEARAAAIAQASSDDPFLAGQGLEALAVLGQQHGVHADAEIERLLVSRAGESGAIGRKAFEAATALVVRAFDALAAERLRHGRAAWEVLRYAGEHPSLEVARGLADGWSAIPERLRDEALLTCCVMPAANREENDAWGRRALDALRDPSEEVRRSAIAAVVTWSPEGAIDALAPLKENDSDVVRDAAAKAIAEIFLARSPEPAPKKKADASGARTTKATQSRDATRSRKA